jgi:hypothetical protein
MPVEVFAVLVRSLAGDRQHRPVSAGEFYRDLLGSGSDSPAPTRRSFLVGAVSPNMMRRVSFAGAVAAGLCAALVLLPVAQKLIAGTSNSVFGNPAAHAAASAVLPSAAASDVPASQGLTPVSFTAGPSGESGAGVGPVLDPEAATASFAPGIVTFESPALIAGSAQSMVAIPIRRLQSTRGAASVEWQIESGSAMPNIDYRAVKPQIVRFKDGESTRSLFIPLVRTAADTETRPPRSFTVQLRSLGRGARLGAVSRIKVTIVPQPIYSELGDKLALK